MRPLRLFVSCSLLFAYILPASRADEVTVATPPSRPWPYMAFVYYMDNTIRDENGARFMRGAVLLTPEYLLVSSIDRPKATEGYPEKTLLARVGALSVDATFTLNEDENEQELEVIKVYRPSNETDKWWSADMQLVRVVQPFNITSAVKISSHQLPLHGRENENKKCSLLHYNKRFTNESDSRVLTEVRMNMLPMTDCLNNQEDNFTICVGPLNSPNKEEDYCVGNTGGPVICDDRLTAMHSVYSQNCSAPHMYKTLDTWASFIKCAIEDTCNSTNCSEICVPEPKDPVEPVNGTENKTTEEADEADITQVDSNNTTIRRQAKNVTINDIHIGDNNVTARNVSSNSTAIKLRVTSKKGRFRNAALCSLRAPSGIVYFIVSRLAFGLYCLINA